MADTTLRASAPAAAPTEGATLLPSFAFSRNALRYEGVAYSSTAAVTEPGRDFFAVAGEAGAVRLSRYSGDLSGHLTMTPAQARAVAAELLAAADAVQPIEPVLDLDAAFAAAAPATTAREA